jgi:hypothetical protein
LLSSFASKLKSWVEIDDAFTTDGNVVICEVCDKKIGCTMKSQLEQHIPSAVHTKHKQLQCSKKQVLITKTQQESGSRNEFFKDLYNAMVAADNSVVQTSSGRVLEHTNHSTVARFVKDGLKVLQPQSVQEEKVLVLYLDAAAYTLKATTALKLFYQNLIHFTCVAEEVRSNFPDVNKLISSTEKVFVKAPQRVQCHRNQLPDVALLPEMVLTRWCTWIQAVNFYNEHFVL